MISTILSKQQKQTVYTTITDTIDILEGNINKQLSTNKEVFLNKITANYHTKSYKQFTFFIKYISNGVNGRTGEAICNLYDKYNSYKFQPNLYLDINQRVKLQEVQKGNFLDNKQLQYANKKVAKALYIEYKCENLNRLFLTITLPSKYHYYAHKGKIKNRKCMFDNYEQSIVESLKQLNIINRDLQQRINIQLKRYYKSIGEEYKPYQYIKVLEYHSSMTGHSHSILYCDDIQLRIMEQEYFKIITKYKLEKTVCEVLTNKKSSSYVYKYLLKNSLPNNKENSLFNQYKSYFNNIRIFSSSNFHYTNQEEIYKFYKYISKYKPNLMQRLKESKLPLYINLENMIKRGDFIFEYETIEQIIVDKQLLENFTIQTYKNQILDIKNNTSIYFKAIEYENEYIKIINLKRLSKVFYINRYTKEKQLIYNTTDFTPKHKFHFVDEWYGTYENEPDF